MRHPDALGPQLGCAAHLARERMDARLSRYDVTPAQTHTLLILQHSGGRVSQRELTASLKVKPSTAAGILDRMEEKGLVVRTVSDGDGRQRLVSMTDKGREKQEQFLRQFREAEAVMVRGFSQEEQALLRSLLDRVIQNLEEDRTL